jgi:HEAT repeat protein
VNMRTVTVILVILILLGAVYGITLYQKAARTNEYVAALDGDDTAAVIKAADALSAAGHSVVRRLADKLSSPDPQIRSRAVIIIGSSGRADDSALLLPLLDGDDDRFVRRDVAVALGKLGGDGVVVALNKAMTTDEEDIIVRAAAATALGDLGASENAHKLAEILTTPPASATDRPGDVTTEMPETEEPPEDIAIPLRVAAAQALGRLDTAEGIEALAQATLELNEPSERVRTAATYALGDLAVGNHDTEQIAAIIRGLLGATEDTVGDVRIAGIQALGKLTTIPQDLKSEVSAALERADGDHHYWVREAARDAIDNLGPLDI